MTRRGKLAALAAVLACLIIVPVTLAAYGDGRTSTSAATTAGRRAGREHGFVRGEDRPRRASKAVTGASIAPSHLTVIVGRPIRRVPRSYLGLSFEYWGMPLFERHLTAFTRILSLLHVSGDGPLILRVGGDSADRSLWDPGAGKVPHWVFRLAPRWLDLTNRLLAHVPARLILDLNLVTASPLRAAAWARAAEAGLRPGSIAAFEIGNEPDIYDRPYWLATIVHLGQEAAVLPAAISAQSYVRDFGAYARALARFAPGAPLMGPALASPAHSLHWIALLVARERPWLRTVTVHRYPYSACLPASSGKSPTVSRLLSDNASAGNARWVRPAALAAHRAGLPLRMTELNSVTCGGRRGVSNTFATGLWAPDALFELMRAGVDGANIHVRADTSNAAMVPTVGGVRERPLLYGLILFDRTLAAGGRLLSTAVDGSPTHQFKAWAVRTPAGQTHVLLINKTARTGIVDLPAAGTGAATVQRLRALSPYSTSGVTLDGRWLDRQGRWRGRATRESVLPGPRGYLLRVPGTSAALVDIR